MNKCRGKATRGYEQVGGGNKPSVHQSATMLWAKWKSRCDMYVVALMWEGMQRAMRGMDMEATS